MQNVRGRNKRLRDLRFSDVAVASYNSAMKLRVLSTPLQLQRVFERLIEDYDTFSWAVAWAGVGFHECDLLRRHVKKARKIVVGTHFYQTHPDFIAEFQDDKAFRFFFDADALEGTFHPKVFVFESEAGECAAIVGSANFTAAALTKNVELALLVEGDTLESTAVIRRLVDQVDSLWQDAKPFPKAELAAYRDKWRRRWPPKLHKPLFKKGRSPLEVPLLRQSWPALYRQMRNTPEFRDRLKMLQETRAFFHPGIRFSSLAIEQRRKVAGVFRDEAATKWRLFGSMAGAIPFKQRIRQNNPKISRALEHIPWEGAVLRSHYEDFLATFRTAFVYKKPFAGVAVPTRLLAMKRPDYFLCIDERNKAELAKQMNTTATSFTLDSYWDFTSALIDTSWWSSAEPRSGDERQAWVARAAMLDCILYFG